MMKTTQLPLVRMAPSVREEIGAVLRDGESLSQFVELAALQAARRRKAQEEFLARGRASVALARESGEFYDADSVLQAMRERLQRRIEVLRADKAPECGAR